MKSSDRSTFTNYLSGLGTLYGKPLSNFLLEIYWKICQPFEFGDIEKAFEAHVRDPDYGQFMPKPADLIRFLEGGRQTQALQAWSKVVKAISHAGYYSSVVFDDVCIHAVISEMDGWIALCQVKKEDLPFKAREFEKRYAAYVLKPPENYPRHLAGLIELQNSATGNLVPLPEFIGDVEKAKEVYYGVAKPCKKFEKLFT